MIDRVARDTATVLAKKDVAERLQALGMQGVGNSPQALGSAIDAESKVWAEVIKSRKIKVN